MTKQEWLLMPWPWLQHGCSKLLLCHGSIYLIPYNSFKMYQVILKYTVLSNCSVSSFMDPSKSATGTPSMIEAPSDHSNLCPPKHICTPATYQSYHVQYIPMTTNTSDGFSCISVRASGASEYLWVRFSSGPPCTAH